MTNQTLRSIVLVALIGMLLGLAYQIEATARPDSGKRGQRVDAAQGDGHGH